MGLRLLLPQQKHSHLGDCTIVLDRFVIFVVELSDRRLPERTADGSIDERVRFLGCFDRFASGFVVDSEETRLPAIIGLEPVRVVVQTGAKRHANEIGIGRQSPGEKVVEHAPIEVIGDGFGCPAGFQKRLRINIAIHLVAEHCG